MPLRVRLSEGLGCTDARPDSWLSLIDESPCVRAIKLANPNRSDEAAVEVSQIHPMFRPRLRFQWLPMGDATTLPTVDRSKGPVAPDVLRGSLRVSFDSHGTELEIDPWAANSTAE